MGHRQMRGNRMRQHVIRSISILALTGVFVSTSIVAAQERDASADPKTGVCNANLRLTNGAGATQFNVCLSNEGNLAEFIFSGANQTIGYEGYQVCSPVGTYSDLGSQGASGWGAPTVVQTNGPGKLPITITRTTTDGQWQLKLTHAKDNTENDFTITMALKNLGGPVGAPVYIGRWSDFDNDGTFGNDDGIVTTDSIQTRGSGLRPARSQPAGPDPRNVALRPHGCVPDGRGELHRGRRGVASQLRHRRSRGIQSRRLQLRSDQDGQVHLRAEVTSLGTAPSV
jgi:hypothetical protein